MSPSATENGAKANGVIETGASRLSSFTQSWSSRLANGLNVKADLGIVPVPKVEGDWTVDKAVDTIGTGKYTEASNSPIGYFHLLERLKTTKREGWRRFDINR